MRIRIIKYKNYITLYSLQQKRWYGWKELMWGGEMACRNALKNLEKNLENHGTIETILLEKDI